MVPVFCALFLLLTLFPLAAEEESFLQIEPRVESGFLAVLSHVYRVGSTANGNSEFDFVTQGGQDILFPYQRYSVEVVLGGKHRVTALYQPLTSIRGRSRGATARVRCRSTARTSARCPSTSPTASISGA